VVAGLKAEGVDLTLSSGEIISAVGEVTTRIKVAPALPPGTLFMSISFPESPVTELFALDAPAKIPSLKACKVKIEKVDANG